MGYYQVQEKLIQKFPDLALEGCSGGGHIKDFGYIRRVHYIVTTDTLSALPDRQSIYDSTFALPPAVLQAYTYENQYNHDADRPRPYLWRSAMMGAWQIDPTKSVDWTAEERAASEAGDRDLQIVDSAHAARCQGPSHPAAAGWVSLGWDVLLESEAATRNVVYFSA